MRFKVYLEQSVELEAAMFMEKMLDKAFVLYLNGEKNFQKCLRAVWPSDAVRSFDVTLPESLPNPVGGQPVLLVRSGPSQIASCMHNDDVFSGFKLNIGPIVTAKSIDAAGEWLEKLKNAVHHEAEHIHSPGTDYEAWEDDDKDQKIKSTLKYLSHEGEIKAHAREFAVAYSRVYPHQSFDLDKAKAMLSKVNSTHQSYFSVDEKWDQYKKYGFPNPYPRYVQLIPQYLRDYL